MRVGGLPLQTMKQLFPIVRSSLSEDARDFAFITPGITVPEMIIRLLTAHLCSQRYLLAIKYLAINGINPMNGAQVRNCVPDIYMR